MCLAHFFVVSLTFSHPLKISENSIDITKSFKERSCSENGVRDFPYPFGSLISYSSDVDMQSPSDGEIIHDFFNENLGLPISDSVWVEGTSAASSFFRSVQEGVDLADRRGLETHLNYTRLYEKDLPTYLRLLRVWHRGNADHFHSWQDGNIPIARFDEFETGPHFEIIVPHKLTPHNFGKYLSMKTLGEPTEELKVSVFDSEGNELSFSINDAEKFEIDPKIYEVDLSEIQGKKFDYEYVWNTQETLDKPFVHQKFRKIVVTDAGCNGLCDYSVAKLDIMSFNRASVKNKIPWLNDHGVRPVLITSHGGFDFSANYGNPHNLKYIESKYLSKFKIYKDTLASIGNFASSSVYHADLLKDIGVEAIWPYSFGSLNYNEKIRFKKRLKGTNQYLLSRHMAYNDLIEAIIERGIDNNGNQIPRQYRDLIRETICQKDSGVFCPHQGDGIPGLTYLSLMQVDKNLKVNNLWYTHFATRGSKGRNMSDPVLSEETKNVMELLSSAHYGWNPNFQDGKRVWVTSASTYVRYNILKEQISKSTDIDFKNSVVNIASWNDPVLDRKVPNLQHPELDLHGFTFYVKNAKKAKVYLNGSEIKNLVRNGADECGKESVTVIDSYTKTNIFSGSVDEDMSVKQDENLRVSDYVVNNSYLKFSKKSSSDLYIDSLRVDIVTEQGTIRLLGCREDSCMADIEPSSPSTIKFDIAELNDNSFIILPLTQAQLKDNHACVANQDWRNCDIVAGKVLDIDVALYGQLQKSKNVSPTLSIDLLRPNPSFKESYKVAVGGKINWGYDTSPIMLLDFINQDTGEVISKSLHSNYWFDLGPISHGKYKIFINTFFDSCEAYGGKYVSISRHLYDLDLDDWKCSSVIDIFDYTIPTQKQKAFSNWFMNK